MTSGLSFFRDASREDWLARAVLIAVLIVNAAGLRPELSVSRVDLNDNVSHFTMVERMVQAVERGENPLDCWSPEWSFGYPMLRVYQTLPHAMTALAYFALGKTVSLMTVFVWMQFLSVMLLPLSFFAAARLLDLGPKTAAAAAILAPLITSGLYGLEYGSYVWAGSGLFPQAVATHFLLLSLGFAFCALRRGERLHVAGVFLGLTFLCHFIYGYIGALSICLLAVMPDPSTSRLRRIRRTVWIAMVASVLAAFQLVPLLLDGARINHSRWEPTWKWDSFGGGQVLHWLVTGELLDHGRLPVLSLLALLGLVLLFRQSRRAGGMEPARRFVLLGTALWILMFCGRPFWGPLVVLLGVPPDLQMHRLVGGVHVFLLLLAALGLAGLWTRLSRRWLVLAAPVVTALLLYPVVKERAGYLHNNAVWGRTNLAAFTAAAPSIDAAAVRLKERGGRVYPGMAANWGAQFKVGDLPFFALLSTRQVPAVAFLYHSMALTGDLMVRFNEWNPDQYRLFSIRTVAAPAGITTPVPPFWAPIDRIGRFQLYQLPDTGYFDIVDVAGAVKTTRDTFYDVNDRWLASDWVGRRQHLLLDWKGGAPAVGPPPASAPPPGRILNERQDADVYQAEFEAIRPAYALFKMTWHPNWKVYIDGSPQQSAMLSPGFLGVPVSPGRHTIRLRYVGSGWKLWMALVGLGIAFLLRYIPERNWVQVPSSCL
jgi:hypothetical protein